MVRRNSYVGDINLGDSSGASLTTMPQGASARRASENRQRALSGSRLVRSDSGKYETVAVEVNPVTKLWYYYLEFSHKNTWFLPLVVYLAGYTAFYLSPNQTESNILYPFLFVSYKDNSNKYGKGPRDFAFVFFYMIFFTFFREFCMQIILKPIARAYGLRKKHKINRFIEQAYCMIYYGLSGPFGLYVMYQTPIWYFNTEAFYLEYPHKTHILVFKVFYLLQAAFWSQQSVVLCLQLEKPRKDFKELVFHHIITMALIFLSYRFHFTWIGVAVYITMDISDFFLAFSKLLNYLDSEFTAVVYFIFVAVWIYLRHYLNIIILYSILTEFKTVGDFTLNWETQQYKCWISQYITFALLLALQLVNVYWLFLIFRIAYRYIFLNIQKDERSDNEDSDEEEHEAKNESRKNR